MSIHVFCAVISTQIFKNLNKNITKLIEFLKLFGYDFKTAVSLHEKLKIAKMQLTVFADHNCRFYVEKTKNSDHYLIFPELDITTKTNVPVYKIDQTTT